MEIQHVPKKYLTIQISNIPQEPLKGEPSAVSFPHTLTARHPPNFHSNLLAVETKKMREVKAEGKYVIFDSRNLAGNKIFKARPSKKPLKQNMKETKHLKRKNWMESHANLSTLTYIW